MVFRLYIDREHCLHDVVVHWLNVWAIQGILSETMCSKFPYVYLTRVHVPRNLARSPMSAAFAYIGPLGIDRYIDR